MNLEFAWREAERKACQAIDRVNEARPLRQSGAMSEAQYDLLEEEKQHACLVAFACLERYKGSQQTNKEKE
jgi:hypothetical protein